MSRELKHLVECECVCWPRGGRVWARASCRPWPCSCCTLLGGVCALTGHADRVSRWRVKRGAGGLLLLGVGRNQLATDARLDSYLCKNNNIHQSKHYFSVHLQYFYLSIKHIIDQTWEQKTAPLWLLCTLPIHLAINIIHFKQHDIYHDTHEAIFNMYQRYILFGFRLNKLDMFTNFMGILMVKIPLPKQL